MTRGDIIEARPRKVARELFQRFMVEPCPHMQRIFVVTHPEATHHVEGLVGGWYDSELTKKGQAMARRIAAALKTEVGEADVRIYSSDLLRTIQTAEAVAGQFGQTVRSIRPWSRRRGRNRPTSLSRPLPSLAASWIIPQFASSTPLRRCPRAPTPRPGDRPPSNRRRRGRRDPCSAVPLPGSFLESPSKVSFADGAQRARSTGRPRSPWNSWSRSWNAPVWSSPPTSERPPVARSSTST